MDQERIKSDLRDLRLLIVEDGDDILSIIDRTFKLLVKDIDLASNGEEAIAAYKKNKPDLIITDLRMPKCDGYELTQTVKEDDPSLPVILITAFEDDLSEEQKKIFNAIVNKPIDFQELVLLIDQEILKVR